MERKIEGIDFVRESLGHILTEKNICVPLSQRSYRWEDEHISDLFKDTNAAILGDLDEYFLGSIVAIYSKENIYIYDGQQRLATCMILIAAIRDYFLQNNDEETARLIEDESLISKDRKTHQETPHFRLNAEDQQFFHDRILLRPTDLTRKSSTPVRDSHKRIIAASKLARDFVRDTITSGLSADQASKRLHRWLDFIKESLTVIWVKVGDERSAFTIFETMNDRGLKLSAADLLKNYHYCPVKAA